MNNRKERYLKAWIHLTYIKKLPQCVQEIFLYKYINSCSKQNTLFGPLHVAGNSQFSSLATFPFP